MCSLCTCPAIPISNRPPVHPAATPPLRGCRRPCTHSTNTARAEAGGIQGGSPPCAGGQEFSELQTRRSLAYLCLLSLREKVGRGADHGKAMISRSARSGECRGAPAPRKEAGSPHPSVEEKKLFIKKIRRPRHLGKLAAALPPVGEKPLHLPPEGGAVVVM